MNNQGNNSAALTGSVLNIQRYCSHDGPGIRTTVFLKGCSLRCKWCGNPESIRKKPELAYDPKLCKGKKECGACLKPPCPEGAFYVMDGPDDKIHVNWDLASGCGEEMRFGLPDEGAVPLRRNHVCRSGTGRSGEGRLLLSQYRRRYHPERRRVPVAAGLQCRATRRERTSAASIRRSRLRATCRGASWNRCCPTSIPCFTITS